MSTLVLRLAGPMQAWGDSSRFNRRGTRREPTKSGVVGMLAAADGRRRTDPIEDLAGLRFGVRGDQPGRIMSDFHTVIDRSKAKPASFPLTRRDYLADACFLVGLEGPAGLLEDLAARLSRPVFPVFLGRRSCPPTGPMVRGIRDGGLRATLENEPWAAAGWFRRTSATEVHLPLSLDAGPDDVPDEFVPDQPVSFHPADRRHGMREVTHGWVAVNNPDGRDQSSHDPFSLL